MIDNLLNESKNISQNKSALDSYSLKDLMELYITYAKPKYFREHGNMSDILEYISAYIIKNLSNNNFLDNLDLYTKLMFEQINLEDMLESTDNIIRIREYNLQDDFFLEFEANTYKLDKLEFKQKYEKELNNIKKSNALYKQIIMLLDNFQQELLIYLNNYIENIPDDQRQELLININNKIDENSLEIINRIELMQDKKKLNLHSRFKDISISELIRSLDISYLKKENYVYSNFQSILTDINKKNK